MSTVAGASKARPKAVPAKKSRIRRWMKVTFWWVVIPLCVFIITFAIVFIPRLNKAAALIPNLHTIIEQVSSQPTVILSEDGETLLSLQEQYRRPVSIEGVPKYVIDATIAAEDKRFYEHEGVDYASMAGIAVQTILHGGDVPRGGSTLTMQLAKRVYTSPVQTVGRKLDDMALAMQIERSLSKDQILELYLNQVYYGRRAYGIGAAADVYFGKKDLNDLTLGEAAMLARLVRRPSQENPFDDYETALHNRDVVLGLMLDEGMIDDVEYEAARAEKPKLAKEKPQTVSGRKLAPYFCDAVMRELQRDFPDVDFKLGGFQIETTLIWEIQEYAEEQMKQAVKDLKGKKVTTAAFFLVDADGAVIAHVGGADYNKNQFDVVVQGARQPGSSFKPFVYATAFNNHVVTPYSMVSKTAYWEKSFGKMVRVQNSDGDYDGEVTVEYAILKSINGVAANVMMRTGPANVVALAHGAFGFKSDLEAVPALALGATAVSPLEMARAYSVFKTEGDRIEPYFIRRVIAPNGDVVKRYGPRIVRNVLNKETARTMNTVLYKAAHNGTGRGVTTAGALNAHGKTGTTNDYRDAWFCGYTERFVAIGWLGGEVREGDRWVYRPMSRVFGASNTPYWGRIVKRAQHVLGEQNEEFVPYYMSNSTDVDVDPESTQFEEIPAKTNAMPPPTTGGETGAPPVIDQGGTGNDTGERSLDIVYVEVCADSGGIASVYCPERVKKPFLDGSQPKYPCPTHKPPN